MKLPKLDTWATGDALSQLFCAAFLSGNANESTSAWSYRTRSRAEPWIDRLFWRDRTRKGRGHCQIAYYRDLLRARKLMRAHRR